ncbi:hypothetical protein [Caryophanon latum]|uniref:Uncharacterized protein n=1 Tax=Caryophanon latum TaxID=33977 RepID=A0A1C0YTY8_9BACL|nr:hypothetical protein [Caryophanon latum]OCS90619.1 hypothetical protein A6K76_10750 [Caryophanon latum]
MMTADKLRYSVEELAACYGKCLAQLSATACIEDIDAICTCIEWPQDEFDFSYPKLETGFDAFDIDFNLTFYQQL